jgi:hypothetical protein
MTFALGGVLNKLFGLFVIFAVYKKFMDESSRLISNLQQKIFNIFDRVNTFVYSLNPFRYIPALLGISNDNVMKASFFKIQLVFLLNPVEFVAFIENMNRIAMGYKTDRAESLISLTQVNDYI